MHQDEDQIYVIVPVSTTGGAFGRRGFGPGNKVSRSAPRPAPGARRQPLSASPQPLVARYTWRACLVGVSLVCISGRLLQFLLGTPEAGFSNAVGGGSATMVGGPPGFLPAALLSAVIGLAWIAQGLMRAPALRIDANGITGFTLLGTRHFAWADINLVRVDWNAIYKQQITIHARVGSPTGGWGIVSPTMIPVMTGKIDRRLADIIAAIRLHRPDMPIQRSPKLDRLIRFFTWYSKEWAEHNQRPAGL